MNLLKRKETLIFVAIVSLITILSACEDSGSKRGVADTDSKADTDSEVIKSSDATVQKDNLCANLDLTLDRQPTTIMLVIDHSASMDLQLGDNDTRWSVVVSTLMGTVNDPASGLVWALESQVNFGIVLFTAKRNDEPSCPMLSTVAPSINNGGEIATIFKSDDETYKGASPVPEGINAAVKILGEMSKQSKKVILLATDGDPQTCDNMAVLNDAASQAATVKAVQSAYDEDISTFVVGLCDEGDDDASKYLQQVANAGVGLSPTGSDKAEFHQGLTENSLAEAITKVITTESRSCIYELDGTGIAEGKETSGTVSLDGVSLEFNNEENGWRLKSTSEFELLGTACSDIQIGEHHLEADFPCESIITID
ncbi:MAG: VWA domain-containing protein [Deltaproteobacteria bacterium]|nr:VWA domain-containing protein [Deltaproteobacteria bacterium]